MLLNKLIVLLVIYIPNYINYIIDYINHDIVYMNYIFDWMNISREPRSSGSSVSPSISRPKSSSALPDSYSNNQGTLIQDIKYKFLLSLIIYLRNLCVKK